MTEPGPTPRQGAGPASFPGPLRRYGLGGHCVESHAAIASRIGVGEERSRQLEHQALHWLRELGDGLARAA